MCPTETANDQNPRPMRSLPPRSTAGQLTLDQHIGVRIPGGQPNLPENRCAAHGSSVPHSGPTRRDFLKVNLLLAPHPERPLLNGEGFLDGRNEPILFRLGYDSLHSDPFGLVFDLGRCVESI